MSQQAEKTKLMLESSSERKRKFVARSLKEPAVKAALLRDQRTKPEPKENDKRRVA